LASTFDDVILSIHKKESNHDGNEARYRDITGGDGYLAGAFLGGSLREKAVGGQGKAKQSKTQLL
jgi:hypothetical protein